MEDEEEREDKSDSASDRDEGGDKEHTGCCLSSSATVSLSERIGELIGTVRRLCLFLAGGS